MASLAIALLAVLLTVLPVLHGNTAEAAEADASWGNIKSHVADQPGPAGKYSTVAIRLNVWFVNQLVDGGNWSTAKDCGQTCVLMAVGQLRRQCLAASNLTAEKSWLAGIYGNQHIGPDGWYTDVHMLARMGRGHWGYTGSYAGSQTVG